MLHAQIWQWVQDAGGSQTDRAGGIGIDGAGNTYMVGTFQGNVAFGATIFTNGDNVGLFVARYDPRGKLDWVRTGLGRGDFRDPAIAVNAAGDVFITGSFSGTPQIQWDTLKSSGGFKAFVAGFSSTGDLRWIRTGSGDSSAYGRGIAFDVTNSVVITGYFKGSVAFDPSRTLLSMGGHDIFVARFDPTGAYLNSGRAGGAQDDEAYGISIDGAGNSVVVGKFFGSATIGSTTVTSAGGSDIVVAKFNSVCQGVTAGRAGGPGDDIGLGVAADHSGNIYVTGTFADSVAFGDSLLVSAGATDAFVAKFDGGGGVRWGVRGGGSGIDAGYGILVDPAGNIYATGIYCDTASFSGVMVEDRIGTGDMFVARYSALGELQWIRTAGGPGADEGRALALDGGNELRVAGGYQAELRIGSFDLFASGGTDIFLGKLGADPSITTGTLATTRFCAGDVLYATFTIKGVFEGGNIFTLQLSDSIGSFADPIAIGSVAGPYPALITAIIPDSMPFGRGYRVRVVSSLPAAIGSANTANLLIDDAPKPTIMASGPLEFCRGDSVMLDAGAGFAAYRWSNGATSRHTTVRQSGVYTVTVTLSTGCAGMSAPVQVVMFSPAKPGIVRSGGMLETGAAVSYQWSLDGTPIPGANGRAHVPVLEGVYQVDVVDSNGCAASSDGYAFRLSGLDGRADAGRPVLYPQPNDGRFSMELWLERGGTIRGEIVDALGRSVFGWDDTAEAGPYRHQVDITHLPAGLYHLLLDAEGSRRTRPILKR